MVEPVPVMRRIAPLVALLLAVGAEARAEGVEARAKLPSTRQRLRGATSVKAASWGMISLGGSALRVLPNDKKAWETLHKIPGKNLYRVAADERGRILASWEDDPSIHLFDRKQKTKQHLTFAKPPPPGPEFKYGYQLADLYFTKEGDAIVYMTGYTGGTSFGTAAYRYALDGKSEPKLLFQQAGHELHTSPRVAVFMVGKDPSRSCDHNGCSIAALYAYEISERGATRRTLVSGEKKDLDLARLIWGSDDERVVLAVSGRKTRHLVRWRWGEAQADCREVPSGPSYDADRTWLTKSGEVVEAWIMDDQGLEIRRHSPKGDLQTLAMPRLPRKTPGDRPDFQIYTLKERTSGELILHWGDNLFLLARNEPPRRLELKSVVKASEWAGADIYVPEPESLWIGLEMGGGRDFVVLKLADIEKRAKPYSPSPVQ